MAQDWAGRIAWIIETYADKKQKVFADRIGTSQPTISNWLAGSEPSGEWLAKIIETFPEVSPDYLLLGREPRIRAYGDDKGVIAVRRAVTAIRRVLRDLEEELSDEVVRDAEIDDALETLRRFGYDIDLGAFGGEMGRLGGFSTSI